MVHHADLAGGQDLLAGLFPAACATSVLYVGMQTVFSLVFSAMVVSDEHTYGPIGTIFALLSYLIAIGVVVILGAVAGRAWHERSPGTSETGHLPLSCRPQLPPHAHVQGPGDCHIGAPPTFRTADPLGSSAGKDQNCQEKSRIIPRNSAMKPPAW